MRIAAEHFAANEHAAAKRQKRGGDVVFEAIREHASTADSPEHAFEREWQRQLLGLAVDDLRVICAQSRKNLHYLIFQAADLAEGERPSYAAIAIQHGITETTGTNHLAWARRTLRELVIERMRGVTFDHIEEFVNEYTLDSVSADGKSMEFLTVKIENIASGWRAKKEYRILCPDELEETCTQHQEKILKSIRERVSNASSNHRGLLLDCAGGSPQLQLAVSGPENCIAETGLAT